MRRRRRRRLLLAIGLLAPLAPWTPATHTAELAVVQTPAVTTIAGPRLEVHEGAERADRGRRPPPPSSTTTSSTIARPRPVPQSPTPSTTAPRRRTVTTSAAPANGTAARTPPADNFARLRQCESGGDYTENTGNGFYGAYQFEPRTWLGVTRTIGAGHLEGRRWVPTWPRADLAPPEVQDRAAAALQAAAGWRKWPACSRALRL